MTKCHWLGLCYLDFIYIYIYIYKNVIYQKKRLLMYENVISYFYLLSWNSQHGWWNSCVKSQDRQGSAKIYTRLRWHLQRALLLLSPWGWHKANLKHLIIFISSSFCLHKAGVGQFTTEASTRVSYFLLRPYSLSTLACLVHLDFSLPLNPGPSGPWLGQCPEQHDIYSALYPLHWSQKLLSSYFSDTHALCGYSSFWHLTHTIHMAFLLSFIYLKTQVHPVFEIHKLAQPVKCQICNIHTIF